MSIRLAVLETARQLADESWTFRLADVVAALPHLNAGTVRTHVASRCCSNARRHHQSHYDYFRALGHGRYRLEPRHRRTKLAAEPRGSQDRLIDTLGSGLDVTLVDRALQLTPTQRLEMMRQAARSLDGMAG